MPSFFGAIDERGGGALDPAVVLDPLVEIAEHRSEQLLGEHLALQVFEYLRQVGDLACAGDNSFDFAANTPRRVEVIADHFLLTLQQFAALPLGRDGFNNGFQLIFGEGHHVSLNGQRVLER